MRSPKFLRPTAYRRLPQTVTHRYTTLAQRRQFIKDRYIVVEFVGMKIINFAQLHLDPRAITNGQDQGREAADDLVNVVDAGIDRLRSSGSAPVSMIPRLARPEKSPRIAMRNLPDVWSAQMGRSVDIVPERFGNNGLFGVHSIICLNI